MVATDFVGNDLRVKSGLSDRCMRRTLERLRAPAVHVCPVGFERLNKQMGLVASELRLLLHILHYISGASQEMNL